MNEAERGSERETELREPLMGFAKGRNLEGVRWLIASGVVRRRPLIAGEETEVAEGMTRVWRPVPRKTGFNEAGYRAISGGRRRCGWCWCG